MRVLEWIRDIIANLLRRVLRVRDPDDPQEVAQALGRAYPTESAELDEETRGLPMDPPIAAPTGSGGTLDDRTR